MFMKTRIQSLGIGVLTVVLAASVGVEWSECVGEEPTSHKEPSGAGAAFEQRLGGIPEKPETLFAAGELYFKDRDYARATDRLRKAVQKDRHLCAGYRLLAEICVVHLHDRKRGEAYMKMLLEANPDDANAFLQRAKYRAFCRNVAAMDEDDSAKLAEIALGDVRRALETAGDDSEVLEESLILGGDLANQVKKDDLAIQYGKQLIQRFPARPNGYLEVAEAVERQGRPDEALEWLRRGLDPTGDSVAILWAIGQSYTENRQFEQAAAVLDRIRAKNSNQPNPQTGKDTEAALNHAEAHIEAMKGNWKKALEMFRANQAGVADSPALKRQANWWIAKCLQELGKAGEAANVIGNTFGDSDEGRAAHAVALAKAGRIDEAIRAWETLIAEEKAPAGATLEVARLLVLKNKALPKSNRNWDEVFGMLDRAEKIDPNRYQIATLRAEAYYEMGRIDRARAILKKAVAAHPKEFGVWNRQITLEIREKRWTEVEKLFDELSAELGDSAMGRLLKARYLLARYGKGATQRLRTLEAGIDNYSAQDRQMLLRGLAIAAIRAGDADYAKSLKERMARREAK